MGTPLPTLDLYCIMSRVTTLRGLIFNEKSDDTNTYYVINKLLRWGKTKKQIIKNRHVRDKVNSDNFFLLEE